MFKKLIDNIRKRFRPGEDVGEMRFRQHGGASNVKRSQHTQTSFQIDDDDDFYRRISPESSKREISPLVLNRAIDLSVKFYTEDPIAKRIINIPIEAMKSAGLRIVAEDNVAQAILDEYWGDDIYGLQNVYWDMFKDGLLTGELHLPMSTTATGDLEVGFIEPQNVLDVILRDGNALIREELIVKVKNEKKVFEIINKGPMIPPARYKGDAMSFAYNRPGVNVKRGVPSLFAQIDYLDLLGQYMFNEAERALALRTFVWEFILEGKTPEECRQWYKDNFPNGEPPKPQSVHVHNKAVTMNAITPSLAAGEFKDFSRVLRNHITGSVGYPENYFGWGENTNYATAREQQLPASWHIESDQEMFVRTLAPILKYRLLVAKRAGYISAAGIATPTMNDKFKINMMPVIPRDLVRYAQVLATVVPAMTQAMEKKMMTHETAIDVVSQLMQNFGLEVNETVIKQDLAGELTNKDEMSKTPSEIKPKRPEGVIDLERDHEYANGHATNINLN